MTWTAIRLSFRIFYRRIGTFLIGNVLWFLVSIPIVTIPAATGALFYLVHRVVAEEEDRAPEWTSHRDFWVGLRKHWLRSSVIGYLDLLALLVLLVTLRFYWTHPEDYLRWLVGPVFLILLVWIGMQMFLYPLLIKNPEEPYAQIVKEAGLLVIAYPFYCLTMATVMIVLLAVSIALAGPVLLLLFALLALIQTVALRAIRIEQMNQNRRRH